MATGHWKNNFGSGCPRLVCGLKTGYGVREKGKMERKLLYAFRGWIAFVAFMDLGSAFRSYIERRSFLDHTETQFIEGTHLCPVYTRHY